MIIFNQNLTVSSMTFDFSNSLCAIEVVLNSIQLSELCIFCAMYMYFVTATGLKSPRLFLGVFAL